MFCQNCGHPVNDTARFCPYCGNPINFRPAPLVGNQQTMQTQPINNGAPQKKREPIPGWRILLGIIGCILATFGFMSMLGGVGLFIGVFLVFIPFIVFVIVYNATIK